MAQSSAALCTKSSDVATVVPAAVVSLTMTTKSEVGAYGKVALVFQTVTAPAAAAHTAPHNDRVVSTTALHARKATYAPTRWKGILNAFRVTGYIPMVPVISKSC
jgi:hypothetical protein